MPDRHPGVEKRSREGAMRPVGKGKESGVNISVYEGYLRLVGEIPLASSEEDLETFLSEISLQLLGYKQKPKLPSFGMERKELTEEEAAIYIGRSRSFLRRCRMYGKVGSCNRGPKFTKYGKRTTRYPIDELDKWLASRAMYEANCEVISDA
jgi:hypothetical protein